MSNTPCPERSELESYANGQLDEEAAARLEQHLETCPDCLNWLAMLANDEASVVARLRRAAGSDPYQEEPGYQEALARAQAVVQMTVSGEDAVDEPPLAEPPQLREIGDYRLLAKLGQGGMGAVYRALQVHLEKTVALKILPRDRMQDAKSVARFKREMKAVGRLNHPNIVQALDARDVDGTSILVMEYVEGENLSRLVRHHGPLRVPDACELVRQAAVGLQYVFENGLVHRDIKPSNLMLNRIGQVKILDLGLALLQAGAAGREMTGSEQAMGTADYVSPEQVQDAHNVDIRADIYSLGCTLYKLLAGRAPFGTPEYHSTFGKLLAHVQREAPPIRDLRPEVSPELAAVLDRMLAKSPDGRYATPADVARAITRFTAGCNLPTLLGVIRRETTIRQAAAAGNTVMDGTSPGPASALSGTVDGLAPGGSPVGDGLAPTMPLPSVSNLGGLISPEDLTTIAGGDTPLARQIREGAGSASSPLAREAGEGQGVRGLGASASSPLAPGTTKWSAGEGPGGARSPLAREAGEGQGVRGLGARRRKPLAIAVALGLLGLMILLGVVIRYRDRTGREHAITVDNNTEVAIGQDGSVQVKPIASDSAATSRSDSADKSRGREPPGQPSGDADADLWKPGPIDNPWNVVGLVPRPAQFPGIQRWQVNTVAPRGIVRNGGGIDWSPDGRLLASCADRVIRVHRTDNWSLVRVFCHYAYRVSFSPDGKCLATDSSPETNSGVRLWDMATGRPGPVLKEGGCCIAWSPDGDRLVTDSSVKAGEIRLWSVGGKCLRTWDSGFALLHRAAWSPNGKWIAVGGGHNGKPGNTLKVWRADGEPVVMPDVKDSLGSACVAWSPDGRWLAVGEGMEGRVQSYPLKVLDTSTWKCVWAISAEGLVADLSWSPDSQMICYTTRGPEVQIVDVQKKTMRRIPVSAQAVSWNRQGTWIALASGDSRLRLWDPIHNKPGVEIGSARAMRQAIPSPDRRWLAVYQGWRDKDIRLLSGDGRPGPLLRAAPASLVYSSAWKPDGSRLASGLADGRILVWAPGKAEPVASLKVESRVRALDWSPDGKKLLSGDGTKVRVWDAESGNPLDLLVGHKGSIAQVAWSPDGKQFASCSNSPSDNKVRLWNANGKPGPVLQEHEQVLGMCWSPHAKQIATWGRNRGALSVRFWNPADGKPGMQFNDGVGSSRCFDWSDDGNSIAIVSGRHYYVFPRNGNAAPKPDFTVHESARWSPNGRRLGGWSGRRYEGLVFDVAQSEPLYLLYGHSDAWLDHFWDTDSRVLTSQSLDRTLRRWNALDGQCLSTTLLLADGAAAYFPQGGKLETTGPEVEKELVYVVEEADGEQKLYNPAEFRTLVEKGRKGEGGRGKAESSTPKGETISVAKPAERPKPVSLDIKPAPLAVKPGEPISELAFVAEPPPLPGVRSWSLETSNHRGEVNSLAYSPDGNTLASTGNDGKILLRDARTGEVTRVLLGHGRMTSRPQLCWSPDGKYLASIDGESPRILIWQPSRGLLLREFTMPQAPLSLDWSPQGNHLVVGFAASPLPAMEVIDPVTGGRLGGVQPAGAALRVAFSPHGDALAVITSAARGTEARELELLLSVFEFPTLARRFAAPLPWESVYVVGMAWSSDGRWIATGGQWVQLWDAMTGAALDTVPRKAGRDEYMCAMAWTSPENTLSFAPLGGDMPIWSWNVAAKKFMEQPGPPGASHAWAMAGTPDGKSLAVGNSLGEVRVRRGIWNAAVPAKRATTAGIIGFSPDGKTLAYSVAHGANGLWPISSLAAPHRLESAQTTSVDRGGNIVWSADGTTLAARRSSRMSVWDVATKRLAAGYPLPEGASCNMVAISRDGRRLTGCGNAGVVLLETATGKLLAKVKEACLAAAWSPVADLVAAGRGNKVVICQGPDLKPVRELKGCPDTVSAIAWSRDGKRLTAKGDARWLGVWEAESGRLLREVRSKEAYLLGCPALRWLDSNDRVAVSGYGYYGAYDVSTGQIVSSFPGYRQINGSVDFSADGKLVAWRQCGTIRLHRMTDGKPLASLLTLPGTQDAVISPDGHWAGPPEAEQQLVYVVLLDNGEQQTLTPAEFAKRFGWKNDPSKALRAVEARMGKGDGGRGKAEQSKPQEPAKPPAKPTQGDKKAG